MLTNIEKGVSLLKQAQIQRADKYIKYQIAKYQVLVSLCEKFTLEDIRINNEYKYVCMFMCLLRYTHFAKEFIRALRYKRVKLEDEDLLPPGDKPEVEMFCDKNRFPLEHRY